MIKVYTKYNCMQCKMTKQLLDSLGKKYEVVNTDDEIEELDRLKSLGCKQLPVVEVDGSILFSGFRPSEIKKL